MDRGWINRTVTDTNGLDFNQLRPVGGLSIGKEKYDYLPLSAIIDIESLPSFIIRLPDDQMRADFSIRATSVTQPDLPRYNYSNSVVMGYAAAVNNANLFGEGDGRIKMPSVHDFMKRYVLKYHPVYQISFFQLCSPFPIAIKNSRKIKYDFNAFARNLMDD